MKDGIIKDAQTIVRKVRCLRIALARLFKEAFSGKNVSLTQYTLLAVLDEKGDTTMGQISASLGMTMGAGTNLVDKLIRLGYVERERSTEDRRIVKVHPTAKGRDTLRSVVDNCTDLCAGFLRDTSAEERAAFITVLDKLVEGTETS